MIDFQQIQLSRGGHDYTAEFDSDTVMKCQSAGVLELTNKPLDFAFECFYWSVQKNHPMSSRRLLREFFDGVILDEEYGLEYFDAVTEEFVRVFTLLFTSRGQKNKKKPTIVSAPVMKIPKN